MEAAIEAYKRMSKKNLKLLEEWEQASNEVEIMDEIK